MSEAVAEAGQMTEDEGTNWNAVLWLVIGVGTFLLAAVVGYEVDFSTTWTTANTILPIVLLVAIVVVFTEPLVAAIPPVARWVATAIAIVSWSVIIFDDDGWTILTFALYAISYSATYRLGMTLAAITSIAWGAAWIADGSPTWTLVIPTGVFFVGVMISATIYRATMINDAQADLIKRLTEAQQELAASERSKGILEERARFAGEIHDTLAQGFTSIVLLSRAAQRSGDSAESLEAIENTAQENLESARRLVEAISPAELDAASLPDALDRHRESCLSGDITSTLRVTGTPRRLTGSVEVTILRAAQEALRNIDIHAKAKNVDITLSYLDDLVALDVRDDGIGFTPGTVADRGSLTGGQGLQLLASRAASLSGEMTIESMPGGGSVLSVLLPSTGP